MDILNEFNNNNIRDEVNTNKLNINNNDILDEDNNNILDDALDSFKSELHGKSFKRNRANNTFSNECSTSNGNGRLNLEDGILKDKLISESEKLKYKKNRNRYSTINDIMRGSPIFKNSKIKVKGNNKKLKTKDQEASNTRLSSDNIFNNAVKTIDSTFNTFCGNFIWKI